MAPTFHIIYTPGTVRYLTFFVHSLLRWSDCSFRLVTNGCSPAEEKLLRAFCKQEARLEFYRLPSEQVMEHGLALNHLQSMTQSDYFCFMDSDIYAIDEFVDHFLPLRQTYTAIFSCSPVWCQVEDQVNWASNSIMAGEYNRTDSGLCLGNTYFAIYENAALSDFRQKYKFGFDRLTWQALPRHHQQRLRTRQLQKEVYDTGKVLNLFLQDEGHPLIVHETSALQHLGGVSIVPIQRRQAAEQQRKPWVQRFSQRLMGTATIRLRRLWQPDYYRFTFSKRRAVYKVYFHDLLVALHENRPLPALPNTGEPEIEKRVSTVTQQLQALYQHIDDPASIVKAYDVHKISVDRIYQQFVANQCEKGP